jgi:tetratricopeptide (TPR) repeat protein
MRKYHERPLEIHASRRSSLAALLILFGVSPCTAADLRKDCQSGQTTACTQILQSNPSDFNALANRGVGFRVSGEYDHAIADFNAAVRLNPDIAGVYLERGLAYDAKGEHLLAIGDFDEAIRRKPELVQAHFGRSIAYEAAGQRELSIVDMSTAVSLDRNMVAALLMQRGYQLRTARQYDQAISAFDLAIEINSSWPLAYFGRAASFDDKGESERAAVDYRKCVELSARTDLEQQRQREARERLDKLSAP